MEISEELTIVIIALEAHTLSPIVGHYEVTPMSSDTYTQYSVFKAEVTGVELDEAADDLFGYGSTVIIVMAESYANNTVPHTPRWNIDFIGCVSEFINDYVEKAAYYYDDGLSQSPLAKNGNCFRKLMAKLHAQAKPLTAADLRERGFNAYSWGMDAFQYISQKARKVQVEWLGRTYFADVLESDEDAFRMAREAIEVKNGYTESKGECQIEKTWLGRPRRHEFLLSN